MDNDGMDGWDVEVPKKEKIDDFGDNNQMGSFMIEKWGQISGDASKDRQNVNIQCEQKIFLIHGLMFDKKKITSCWEGQLLGRWWKSPEEPKK